MGAQGAAHVRTCSDCVLMYAPILPLCVLMYVVYVY